MSIASRITSIEGHIGDVYDTMALGGDTTVNKNIQNINNEIVREYKDFLGNGTGTLWTNWEKVTGSGTSVTLNNTMKGNMRITLNGNTSGSSILPSGYEEVEYLISTGTQYIQTQYTPVRYDELVIQNVKPGNQSDQTGLRALFSAGTADPQFVLILDIYADGIYYNYKYFTSGGANQFYQIPKGDNSTIKFNSNGIYVNDTLKGTNTSYIGAANSKLRLLFRANGTANKFIGTFGRTTITNNGTTKLDLIPCYRTSDNVIGMYDLVSNTFLTNAGTGTFSKGSTVTSSVTGNNTITIGTQNYPINLGNQVLRSGDKIQGTRNSWEILRADTTTETITDETLIYQLNDLYQNATSSNTTTTITQTNEGLSFILDVTALEEMMN